MRSIGEPKAAGKTRHVHEGGFVALPNERRSEIPGLRSEFHDIEAKKAILFVRAWKPI
jgi:hypothetical protein